jgi:hypothetical protein
MHGELELGSLVMVLLAIGAAWTHTMVKLDRIERRGKHNTRCLKRIRLRLAYVERWLPPHGESPPT